MRLVSVPLVLFLASLVPFAAATDVAGWV